MSARSANGHDRRVALSLALFFLVLYGGLHHGHFKGTDEIGAFETTRAIYERGSLSVPPGQHTFRGPDGEIEAALRSLTISMEAVGINTKSDKRKK